MPAMFALCDKVIANAAVATFSALGTFATLLLVDFTGPLRVRLEDQAALALASGVLVCLAPWPHARHGWRQWPWRSSLSW